VQNAKIEIQKSQYNLYNAQKETTQKIESLWLNSAAAQSQTEAALAQREASNTAYTIAQQQFDLGATSYVDLQLSMNNYLSASQKYIVAKHTLLIYQLLIQYYNGQFNL
jgi:outer membrane protein